MKEKVISFLTDNGIPFTVKEHPAVYTMAEMEALGLNDLGPIPKNLFIRDGKGKQHFLITAAMDTAIDMKQLGEILGGGRILDYEDFAVSNILLPVGSLIFLLFCVTRFGWGFDNYLEECNRGKGIRMPRVLRHYFRYVLPVLILVILYSGLFS